MAISAVIPAVLYFFAVYVQIHFHAEKRGLKGLSRDKMPDVKLTIYKYGYMSIPVFVLVYLLIKQRTAIYAAFYTLLLTWLLSLIGKETRITPNKLVAMSVKAARDCLNIAVAMASAGFVVGVLGMTGLGLIIADSIVMISHNSLFLALLLIMVVSIVLGMGLPTSACYVIASSICVPILRKMGIPAFQAHFFVLYYACLSTITPPVALASFVGAGIAGANVNKVGWTAFRLALAAFIIPIFFVYSPEMLLLSNDILSIIWATITGIIGITLLGAACEGFFLHGELHLVVRGLLIISSVLIIEPGVTLDLIGFLLAGISLLFNKFLSRKHKIN